MNIKFWGLLSFLLLFVSANVISQDKKGTNNRKKESGEKEKLEPRQGTQEYFDMKLKDYKVFPLKSDISHLSEDEKEMLRLFFHASEIIDELFWMQSYGPKSDFLKLTKLTGEVDFGNINYGPWDRLNGNQPFIHEAGNKPLGANFYPKDITKEEFEALDISEKTSPYTILTRNVSGKLEVIPYHIAYQTQIHHLAGILLKAAQKSKDPLFTTYLTERANSLKTSEYFQSDMAWMDLKNNNIDFVIGPIENYEDQLFGYKTSFEAYILIKDRKWSELLDKFTRLLPELQAKLPVKIEYKAEIPASGSDIGVYDAVYYAGDCNAGSKTIAINLPNDERVQLEKGSRKLQLKNSMQAKFESILVPISKQLIIPAQRKYIKFDAFFQNTMFHEIAHGMGVKNTINGKGPVRESLRDQYSWIEEGKADIMGLFMVEELMKTEQLMGNVQDNYVTFLAGIFRSIRFGTASAHAKANLVRYNYFHENGAFTRNNDGYYSVNFEAMQRCISKLTTEIIELQANGDYSGVKNMFDAYSVMTPDLIKDLDRLKKADIPVDVVFEQGPRILGL
jgi:hypothetical protein